VIAAPGAVLDAELGRIGEGLLQEVLQGFDGHAAMVPAQEREPVRRNRLVVAPSRHDPYKAFKFRVEIDGLTSAAFSEVSGLDSETAVIEYRTGSEPNSVRKLPGLTKYPNIVLKRGITRDAELSDWRQRIVEGNIDRRNGSIVLQDDSGADQVRWIFRDGWPCKLQGPHLNAHGNDIAIETLEISHEGLERV